MSILLEIRRRSKKSEDGTEKFILKKFIFYINNFI